MAIKWESGKRLAFLLIKSAEEDIKEWIDNRSKTFREMENRRLAKKKYKKVLRMKKNCERACRVVGYKFYP